MKNYIIALSVGFFVGASALYIYQTEIHMIPFPVAQSPDGGKYQGQLNNGIFEGKGQLVWSSGDHYEGMFKDGFFHGQGKLTQLDGFVYEGEFTNGTLTGFGTMMYQEGDKYTGDFKNGRQDGKGIYTYENTVYEGEFSNNKLHGKGRFTDELKNIYVGNFKEGKFSGNGVYTTNDGKIYDGEFVEGQIITGSYMYNDGTEYTGGFSEWSYHGLGTLKTNRSTYVGTFEYGSYHGDGRLTESNGDVYDGEFMYGMFDGKGTLTFFNAIDGVKEKSGHWKNGKLKKSSSGAKVKSPAVNNEIALYNQSELLDKTFQALEANNPNEIELYFLGVSGDGSQSVFRREIQFVQKKFDTQFSTKGKSILLINSRDTVKEIPLATITSISRAIQNIEQRMDLENDVLFLYITSHGSKTFNITLNQERMTLPNLSAQHFADMLNNSKIKWKVIVVSACYSGGLIPYLQNDTSLIITSASSDRTSFGCKETANFTYFGEAYFKQAIDQTNSFVEAFDTAVELITMREKLADYQHSEPRIHKPELIINHLKKWRSSLSAK